MQLPLLLRTCCTHLVLPTLTIRFWRGRCITHKIKIVRKKIRTSTSKILPKFHQPLSLPSENELRIVRKPPSWSSSRKEESSSARKTAFLNPRPKFKTLPSPSSHSTCPDVWTPRIVATRGLLVHVIWKASVPWSLQRPRASCLRHLFGMVNSLSWSSSCLHHSSDCP